MDASQVYNGKWVNYSFDGVGKTQWTLTAGQGGFLLSVIAMYITLVGEQFWSIMVFVIHQMRATAGPHDGIHHVQQVVYRNQSPLEAAWTLFTSGVVYSGRKAWYWPVKVTPPYAERRKMRGFLAILLPLVIWGGFVLAASLSSLLTRQTYSGNEVKLVPQNCGFIQWGNMNDTSMRRAFELYTSKAARAALAYVDACYGNDTSLACHTLPQRNLAYGMAQTNSCPFGDLCKTSPIILDTGWMDSHVHFGINAPSSDRVQVRKQATCAVLDLSTVTETETVYDGSVLYYEYFLGQVADVDYNYTTWALNRSSFDRAGYSIRPYFYMQGADGPAWLPIDKLNVADGDTSIFLIDFGIMQYLAPVSDPLLSATTPSKRFQVDGLQYYESDNVAGMLACVDRWQMQDPTGKIQTDLAALYQVLASSSLSDLSPAQTVTAYRLMYYGLQAEMYSAVNGLDASALRAQRKVSSVLSMGLPDNQWIDELQGWFETTLALLQQNVITYASKSMDDIGAIEGVVQNDLANPALTAAFDSMCYEQKLRNVAEYQSFSVVGVAIILGLGLVVITLSLVQDTVMAYVPRLRRRMDQWRTDSVLHLQRLAFQNNHQGLWERTREEVPAVRGLLDRADRDSGVTSYTAVDASDSKPLRSSAPPPAYVRLEDWGRG